MKPFCAPIGHQWNGVITVGRQPADLSAHQLKQVQVMALTVTNHLGGVGLFGVEFFLCGEEVIFPELSPRPHDTGLVTLISQNLNEFELHLRAVLNLPIPHLRTANAVPSDPGGRRAVVWMYEGVEEALQEPDTQVLLFGKLRRSTWSTHGRRPGLR